MTTSFDRSTETHRERRLMERIRSGRVQEGDLESIVPDFFLKVQIQTTSPCNAACVMCPWPDTKGEQAQGMMPEDLFHQVVDQMAGRGVARTSLFLMNEPLLDRRLERLTDHVRQRMPETRTLIFTNGILLNEDRARGLAEAGLDEINVSLVAFDSPTFERNVGTRGFRRMMENLRRVVSLYLDGELGDLRLKIVALELPGLAEGIRAFEETTGMDVYVKPVTNRAGNIDTDVLGVSEARDRFTACQRPFVKAYVLFNGDVVLCNCDWRRTTIVGNVRDATLEAIWRGPRLMEIRRSHLLRSLPDNSICASCDYPYRI